MIKDPKETDTPDQLDILIGEHPVRVRRHDGSMVIGQPGEIIKNVPAFEARRLVVARRGRAAAQFVDKRPEPAPDKPKRGRGRPPKEETAAATAE